MSSSIHQDLPRIFEAVEVLSPLSFSFAGGPPIQLAPGPPVQVPGQPPHPLPEDPLIRGLQSVLYERSYCHRVGEPEPPTPAEDPQLLARLSQANLSRDRWDVGWQIFQVGANGQIFVLKGERQKSALPGEYIADWSPLVGPQPNSVVTLRIARESFVMQPGFYYMYSEIPPDIWDDHHQIRFYFHSTPEGVPALLAPLTQGLNRYLVPYRMKTLSAATLYTRSDATVLYCARRFFDIVARLIAGLPATATEPLRESTPLFTKKLHRGIGLAEDPNNGESFGMHRSRLVAEGIYDAWRQGKQDAAARLEAVTQRFTINGLSLDEPYLRPGSVDLFDITDPEEGMAA